LPAARAAECAGEQGRFWAFHDLLYSKQESLAVLPLADLAERAFVRDARRFARCLDVGSLDSLIRSGAELARRLGARGTPALFIDGKSVYAEELDSANVAAMVGDRRAATGLVR
jgi:protein-disulfide isomerase